VYVCVCMCVHMYVYVSICMYMYVYGCVYMCMNVLPHWSRYIGLRSICNAWRSRNIGLRVKTFLSNWIAKI